jgi:hyaluronate lyase
MNRRGAAWGIFLVLCVFLSRGFADSMDDLRLRWRQMLTGGVSLDASLSQVRARLSSMQSTANRDWSSMQKSAGRQMLWTDLASTTDSAEISSAYGRLRGMALAWATPGQSLYQDAGLLADLISGMEWMDAHRYNASATEFGNWYDWEIGSPAIVADIAVLLYNNLTAGQLARYMAAVNRFDADPRVLQVATTRAASTGANLTDKCKIALLRGLIMKDASQITLAVNSLSPVFAYVTSGDGFYQDGSFIQHTHHAYTGSYGIVLLSDVANLLWLLSGSPWDVTDPARANLWRWVSDSFAPLIYSGALADLARGRAISRSGTSDHVAGHITIAALLRITQFTAPDLAAPLRSAIKRWLQDDTTQDFSSSLPLDLIGEANGILKDPAVVPAVLTPASHVYAAMDRVLHLRPAWGAGIAMHSSRIYNYESINNENLKGWHTADGMTYLYNSDLTQFDSSFWPTVDPQRLPGTTVIAGSTARQSQFGGSNVAGGTSLDGYSAVMMQLVPDGRQLRAKKSWFLLDDELVALGADIQSTGPDRTVETIIENRRLTPDAVFTADPSGAWANLASNGAGIGYFFPASAVWQSLAQSRTGAWRDINVGGSATPLTAQYQTLWFDHGVKPAGAAYAYVLLPGKSADDTAAYAANPAVQIVENDGAAQAVTHAGLGIQAVNFWTASAMPVAGISSDGVASVLVHQANGLLNVAVSDPTQANSGTLHIEIAAAAQGVVSQDDGVSVDQTGPTVRLSVNVNLSHGKAFRASLSVGAP